MLNTSELSTGMLVYNTDRNRIYEYTDQGFLEILTSGNVYTGAFIISGPGSSTVSDLPFEPSQITFTAHANVESFDLNSNNGTSGNDRGIPNSFGTMNGFAKLNTSGGITQQVIYIGGSGTSINNISRFASSSNCIGLRYGDQNGNDLGRITASLNSFTTNGFSLDVTYTNGTITVNNNNPVLDVQPEDILDEAIVVLFTAYR